MALAVRRWFDRDVLGFDRAHRLRVRQTLFVDVQNQVYFATDFRLGLRGQCAESIDQHFRFIVSTGSHVFGEFLERGD